MTEQTASVVLSLLALGRLSLNDAKTIYDYVKSATGILDNRSDIKAVMPDATDNLAAILNCDIDSLIKRAEEEQEWCENNNIRIVCIGDADYPHRLRQCHDAPMVLYVRGNANLNAPYTINMVGTRKCTPYGCDVVNNIVHDLAASFPDITINSGLAYGIDIAAHRAALQCGISTVGVTAHGQDTLYPALHKKEANEMVANGGAVVTEYPRFTRPEARNFLQRNRIIAGMSDATIVVESASHGGGLVTARIAQDYGRDVFAVPGPVNAEYSKGCNNLIRDNKAQLITSAQDIIEIMNWQMESKLQQARQAGITRSMFVTLTADEQKIVDALRDNGDSQANALTTYTGLPINVLNSALFSLEMQGVIKALSGNTYHLVS